MNKPRLVPLLLICCALALGAAGCADLGTTTSEPTTTGDASTTTVLAETTTTATIATTTTEGVTTTAPAETTTSTESTTTTTAAPTTTTTAAPVGWIELSPTGTVPDARESHGMVFDLNAGEVVLFGGTSSDGVELNDTWVYDPTANAWTELSPAGALPSARCDFAMTYASTRGYVFLFGGWDGGACLGDTWRYFPSGSTWKRLTPVGKVPPPRRGTAMVYLPDTDKVILFGGKNGSTYFDDLWIYDPAANTWSVRQPAGGIRPEARVDHSMVYDPVSKKVLLFGGNDDATMFNDIWAYDPAANAWTDLGPAGPLPPARYYHAMAFDTDAGLAILYGGAAIHRMFLSDTWSYDPAANEWKDLTDYASVPEIRTDPAMTYDPNGQRMILFGGYSGAAYCFDDTWAYYLP
jgi:N-acetylneuraminic acid mutarotase